MLYLALAILVVAFWGAILQPIAVLLDALPSVPEGVADAFSAIVSSLGQALLWVLLALLIAMAVHILWARLSRRRSSALADEMSSRYLRGNSKVSGKIAVAITAYDEAAAIAQVVADFKSHPQVAEVIVIDNNSRDDTATIASKAGARVVRETRQGYGYACLRGLCEGLESPEADFVVLAEGDGTFAARDLDKFLAYLSDAELVLGTRVVPGLVQNGSQMDYFFTWGNLFISSLIRLRFWNSLFLGSVRLSDVGCTYRAIRRDALQRITNDLEVGGNHFSPHMILVALLRGLSVVEIPVAFHRRIGNSKGASQGIWKGFVVGLEMIWHIMTYRLRASRETGQETRGTWA